MKNVMEDLVLPENVNDLIELLNKVYPEKSASVTEQPNQIYFQAGQRDVVKFINTLKERDS